MHVVYVGYGYDAGLRCEAEFLAACPTIPAFARALTAAGATVTVMQRFSSDATINEGVAEIVFTRDRLPPRLRWQIPRRFHQAVCTLARSVPDPVIHVNGLIFPAQIYALRKRLPRSVPIVVQHHAERPSTGIKRIVQRHGLGAADAFLFTSSALAEPWIKNGVISSRQRIYEVMESPVTFDAGKRMNGVRRNSALFLWVGRLNAGKDPLTVLSAFEQASRQAPFARLQMIYTDGDLTGTVRERIAASEVLRASVDLVGSVRHNDLPCFYSNADFFVSGSHYEGSGYALAEAMSFGVVPVISRIASFSTMANSAAHFWSPGNAAECARAMIEAMSDPVDPQRERVRRQFRNFLSADAIAHRAMTAYAHEIERRRSRA